MKVLEVYRDLLKYENQVILFENEVIDSLQFLENSFNKLRYAELEFNALTFVNDKIKESYDKWNKELFDNGQISTFPVTIVEYFGTKMLDDDAVEKIVGSFFHYLHSFFDNFAQFINSCLLGNIALDKNKVSFSSVKQKIEKLPEYNLVFNELDQFVQTDEFQYIEDFNNINKHQYTIDVKNDLYLNNGKIEQQIPQFQKRVNQPHNAKELNDKITKSLQKTLVFFETVTDMILLQLKQNSHNYINNRYHSVSIKAQVGFGDGQDGGSIILTIDNSNIKHGDTFYVLLSKKEDALQKIVTENIETDTLIVHNSNGDHIAILEAMESAHENIIRYRKYKLDLNSDMKSAFFEHFLKPKKYQVGFGKGDIIHKVDES